MAVEVAGPRPPSNKIGGEEELRLKPEKKVWVQDPRTGERAFVSLSNARDMTERRPAKERWMLASPLPTVNPMASIAEQKQADELDKARELLRAAGELPAAEQQGAVLVPTSAPAVPGPDPKPDALAAAAVEVPAEEPAPAPEPEKSRGRK